MRKIGLLAGSILLLAGIQCQKMNDSGYLIAKDRVGKLKRTDRAADLETIFAADSLVRDSASSGLGSGSEQVRVYEKGGKPLLLLTPAEDSLNHIENIRILDPRFTTEEGVGLSSTFKDIKEHYPIRKIVTSLNNVVIFVKGQDFYFTISREELPASLRYTAGISVEEVQIPDKARIKYLMVGWD